MKIGVVSDSHSDLDSFEYVLDFFAKEKIDVFIHCGDWSAKFMVKLLGNYDFKCYGVYGNCDFNKYDYSFIDVKEFLDLKLISRIGVCHGHNMLDFNNLVENVDVIFTGHTHIPLVEKLFHNGREIIHINPGSCSKPRQGKRSFAIFNGRSLECKFFNF